MQTLIAQFNACNGGLFVNGKLVLRILGGVLGIFCIVLGVYLLIFLNPNTFYKIVNPIISIIMGILFLRYSYKGYALRANK